MAKQTPEKNQVEPSSQKETSFWDTTWGLILLVGAILLARYYIAEPYKIPSGSMEPTLFGHQDYGDRIVTNKLAYVTPQFIYCAIAALVGFVVVTFIASRGWKRKRSIVMHSLAAVLLSGGLFLGVSNKALAAPPQRFDVVVFSYESKWGNKDIEGAQNTKINYIKRLIGLPGETIVISGGDLYRQDPDGKLQILRKWQTPGLQETLWYPVAKAWDIPLPEDIPAAEKTRVNFPWEIEAGADNTKLAPLFLDVNATTPVTMHYAYPVTNIYLKQGRWPFEHIDCPESNKVVKDASGAMVNSSENVPPEMECDIENTWRGVRCPHCKKIFFPIVPGAGLVPVEPDGTRAHSRLTPFFYGGNQIVGDLKLTLELDVQNPGTLELQVGNNFHRARWRLPQAAAAGEPGVLQVKYHSPALTVGKHSLSLAYVDGTVLAELDGKHVEELLTDPDPLGPQARNLQSLARVAFSDGMQARVTKLDLFRDLYYTTLTTGSQITWHNQSERSVEDDSYVAHIPADHFMMLGDNSPSSADSRVWGFVPRENLIGRAGFIWWPPSRWRLIR